MREIVRSVHGNNTQFAAIEWNKENLLTQTFILFQSDDHDDLMHFNETIEQLYKKWLVGEDCTFNIKHQNITWNVADNFVPTFLAQQEKNEYLAKKIQKWIQEKYSATQVEKFKSEIENLKTIIENTAPNDLNNVSDQAKNIDDNIKKAVAATKNISLEQKWVENGISNEAYLEIKPSINAVFDLIKQKRANAFHVNYNTISPLVEAAYTQSKTDENYNETRKELIALQKEVAGMALERWQKNELMDRLRAAFDHINTRQDEWRAKEDSKRAAHTESLQKEFDLIIPQALNSNFAEGFEQLKQLQDLTNKASIQREKRDVFYNALNEAFTTLKQKADSENETNYETASKQIEVAILASNNTDLFKDARAILIAAQNDLKEIRLPKNKKDELFGKLREAFDKLNEEQDAYFKEKRKENKLQLEEVLMNMKRVLARKKEGIETLYQAKSNIESKTGIIKVAKNSTNDLVNQFLERLTEINIKIEGAEKDIAQLEKKVEKIEGELKEIKAS